MQSAAAPLSSPRDRLSPEAPCGFSRPRLRLSPSSPRLAGLAKLCRDLKATWKCMTTKPTEILPIESEQRAKLKWGCYNAAKVVK